MQRFSIFRSFFLGLFLAVAALDRLVVHLAGGENFFLQIVRGS